MELRGHRLVLVGRSLDEPTRQALAARQRELEWSLAPGADHELASAVSGMLMGFRGAPLPAGEAASVVAVYVAAVRDRPLWAVRALALRYASGQVPGASLQYAPSSAEFAKAVSDEVERHMDELANIRSVLSAAPAIAPPPRDMRPSLEQLKERFGPNWGLGEIEKAKDVETSEQKLERIKATPIPDASPELVRVNAERDKVRAGG